MCIVVAMDTVVGGIRDVVSSELSVDDVRWTPVNVEVCMSDTDCTVYYYYVSAS